jgi:hypothetical protein
MEGIKEYTEIRDLILGILEEAGPRGLNLNEIIVHLEKTGRSVSERTIRRGLEDLLRDGRIVATNRKDTARGPGRPRRVYILSAFLPKQTSLFELIEGVREAEVKSLDELPPPERHGDVALLREEQIRKKELVTLSVLERIANGRLEDEHLASAIIRAAPALADRDPLELLLSMLDGMVRDLKDLASRVAQAGRAGDRRNLEEADKAARLYDIRSDRVRRYFGELWGLGPALSLPSLDNLRKVRVNALAPKYDRNEAERRLKSRLYGRRVLQVLEVGNPPQVAAGTDASVADIRLEHREGSFLLPHEFYVFTAAAALEDKGAMYTDYDIFPEELRYYDDRRAAEEGLLLAPEMRELLGEEDLRHARYAALSLRQYAEDRRVLHREARWRPTGRKTSLDLPPPVDLIIRDGRIFPTVHRLRDYEAGGIYGRLVRNEITLFNEIFDQIRPGGPHGRVGYTGVVKEPEFSWLSPIVFWFLYETGEIRDIELVYRAPLPDIIMVHLLFLGLARSRPGLVRSQNRVFSTFGMVRRFSDIVLDRDQRPPRVDGRTIDEDDLEVWLLYFRDRLEKAEAEGRSPALNMDDYHHFAMLCAYAGVLMVYGVPCSVYRPLIAESASGAHFRIPRLEVAAHLGLDKDLVHAGRVLERLLAWFCDPAHRDLDDAHALTGFGKDSLPPWVPKVVIKAHEAATFARTEMASFVEEEVRRLIRKLASRLR